MDTSKMTDKDLQAIYTAGLARRVPKEVLSVDTNTEDGMPIEVQQDIPVFIGEPGYVEAVTEDAPLWEPLRLVYSKPKVPKTTITTGGSPSDSQAA